MLFDFNIPQQTNANMHVAQSGQLSTEQTSTNNKDPKRYLRLDSYSTDAASKKY